MKEMQLMKKAIAGYEEVAQRDAKTIYELREQLARASKGGWVEIKEGCELPEYGETVRMICGSTFGEPYQEICAWESTMVWEEARACGITHYIKLDWPSPPLSVETPEVSK